MTRPRPVRAVPPRSGRDAIELPRSWPVRNYSHGTKRPTAGDAPRARPRGSCGALSASQTADEEGGRRASRACAPGPLALDPVPRGIRCARIPSGAAPKPDDELPHDAPGRAGALEVTAREPAAVPGDPLEGIAGLSEPPEPRRSLDPVRPEHVLELQVAARERVSRREDQRVPLPAQLRHLRRELIACQSVQPLRLPASPLHATRVAHSGLTRSLSAPSATCRAAGYWPARSIVERSTPRPCAAGSPPRPPRAARPSGRTSAPPPTPHG